MIVKIMVAGNGVHLHHLILEIFVLNLKDQKIDFTVTILHNPYMAFRCQGKTSPIDRTTFLRISVFRKIV